MAKKKKGAPKGKSATERGRPKVEIEFPAELLDQIDAAVAALFTDRSEWVRQACIARLKTEEKGKADEAGPAATT